MFLIQKTTRNQIDLDVFMMLEKSGYRPERKK